MKILIYGLNYAPEITGIGKYSGQLGCWLHDQGNDVKAVSTPPYYPSWKISFGYRNCYSRENVEGVDVLRCPLFVPSQPSTMLRLLHLISFVVSSSVSLLCLIRWRPDVVVNVVPALFSSIPAWIYSRLTGAKFIIHIQDFESDALFSLSANQEKGIVKRVWRKVERFIFSRADIVTTISDAMMLNAISKGANSSKVFYFPNWSETSLFRHVDNVESFKKTLLGDRKEKIILYSGNIGRKQNLGLVVECARQSQNDKDDFLYVLCGDGAGKSDLVKLKDSYSLNNLLFYPLQTESDFPRLLAMSDVHLVVQNPDVANAVLPSKLTNILAVGGNAVITTYKDTEIGRLIDNNPGIAFPVAPDDPGALLAGIKLASRQKKINNIAMTYAEQNLAKEPILQKFEELLIKTTSVKSRAK